MVKDPARREHRGRTYRKPAIEIPALPEQSRLPIPVENLQQQQKEKQEQGDGLLPRGNIFNWHAVFEKDEDRRTPPFQYDDSLYTYPVAELETRKVYRHSQTLRQLEGEAVE